MKKFRFSEKFSKSTLARLYVLSIPIIFTIVERYVRASRKPSSNRESAHAYQRFEIEYKKYRRLDFSEFRIPKTIWRKHLLRSENRVAQKQSQKSTDGLRLWAAQITLSSGVGLFF